MGESSSSVYGFSCLRTRYFIHNIFYSRSGYLGTLFFYHYQPALLISFTVDIGFPAEPALDYPEIYSGCLQDVLPFDHVYRISLLQYIVTLTLSYRDYNMKRL